MSAHTGAPGAEIGVLIVDDHRMFAESIARVLRDEEGIAVLGIAVSGGEAIVLAGRLEPNVVLLDYQMPDEDGVSVARRIKSSHPDTMVVMVTGSADDRVLVGAIDAGCSGFVTKDQVVGEVASAVRSAAAGEALITPAMLARLLPKMRPSARRVGDDLTQRELEVLRLLALGLTNRAIADELLLSLHTVRNHVQAVLTKLGGHSKLEAVAIAVRGGVIDYPSTR